MRLESIGRHCLVDGGSSIWWIRYRRRYYDPIDVYDNENKTPLFLSAQNYSTRWFVTIIPSTVARKFPFQPPSPPLLRPTFNRTQTGRWNEKKIRLKKSKETTKLHRRGGWATVNGPPFGGEELAPIKRPWKGWTRTAEWAQGES